MTVSCVVRSCKNYFEKTKTARRDISYHRFPKDRELCAKWIKACKPKGSLSRLRVCSDHFRDEDFVRDLKAELLQLPTKRKLKETAIPTLRLGPIKKHAIFHDEDEDFALNGNKEGNMEEIPNGNVGKITRNNTKKMITNNNTDEEESVAKEIQSTNLNISEQLEELKRQNINLRKILSKRNEEIENLKISNSILENEIQEMKTLLERKKAEERIKDTTVNNIYPSPLRDVHQIRVITSQEVIGKPLQNAKFNEESEVNREYLLTQKVVQTAHIEIKRLKPPEKRRRYDVLKAKLTGTSFSTGKKSERTDLSRKMSTSDNQDINFEQSHHDSKKLLLLLADSTPSTSSVSNTIKCDTESLSSNIQNNLSSLSPDLENENLIYLNDETSSDVSSYCSTASILRDTPLLNSECTDYTLETIIEDLLSTFSSSQIEIVLSCDKAPLKFTLKENGIRYFAGWIAKKFRRKYPQLSNGSFYEERNPMDYSLPRWIRRFLKGGSINPSPKWLKEAKDLNNLFKTFYKRHKVKNKINICILIGIAKRKHPSVPTNVLKYFFLLRFLIKIRFLNEYCKHNKRKKFRSNKFK